MRDKLTLLISKHKAKMRQEEKPPGIKREETELDQALEEIIDKEKLANKKAPGKETRKGKKSSCRGTQAKRYGTFRADREKTF